MPAAKMGRVIRGACRCHAIASPTTRTPFAGRGAAECRRVHVVATTLPHQLRLSELGLGGFLRCAWAAGQVGLVGCKAFIDLYTFQQASRRELGFQLL